MTSELPTASVATRPSPRAGAVRSEARAQSRGADAAVAEAGQVVAAGREARCVGCVGDGVAAKAAQQVATFVAISAAAAVPTGVAHGTDGLAGAVGEAAKQTGFTYVVLTRRTNTATNGADAAVGGEIASQPVGAQVVGDQAGATDTGTRGTDVVDVAAQAGCASRWTCEAGLAGGGSRDADAAVVDVAGKAGGAAGVGAEVAIVGQGRTQRRAGGTETVFAIGVKCAWSAVWDPGPTAALGVGAHAGVAAAADRTTAGIASGGADGADAIVAAHESVEAIGRASTAWLPCGQARPTLALQASCTGRAASTVATGIAQQQRIATAVVWRARQPGGALPLRAVGAAPGKYRTGDAAVAGDADADAVGAAHAAAAAGATDGDRGDKQGRAHRGQRGGVDDGAAGGEGLDGAEAGVDGTAVDDEQAGVDRLCQGTELLHAGDGAHVDAVFDVKIPTLQGAATGLKSPAHDGVQATAVVGDADGFSLSLSLSFALSFALSDRAGTRDQTGRTQQSDQHSQYRPHGGDSGAVHRRSVAGPGEVGATITRVNEAADADALVTASTDNSELGCSDHRAALARLRY